MSMSKKILVIAAHPDDEILGAGGTLRKYVEERNAVYCLILGQGCLSRDKSCQDDLKHLHNECTKAGEIIGFKEIYFSNFPDNSFDGVPILNIIKDIEKYLEQIKPDIVYTHHEGDLNVDHEITFKAVLTACRPCNKNNPNEIYTFETLSSTEWQNKDHQPFKPNVYCDISSTLEKKIQAMRTYKSELREYPHSRSKEGIRILANFRGLECGLEAAEGFNLIRKIS